MIKRNHRDTYRELVGKMVTSTRRDNRRPERPRVTAQDLERVLAMGRLLLSVLTPEELDELRDELTNNKRDTNSGRHYGTENR